MCEQQLSLVISGVRALWEVSYVLFPRALQKEGPLQMARTTKDELICLLRFLPSLSVCCTNGLPKTLIPIRLRSFLFSKND